MGRRFFGSPCRRRDSRIFCKQGRVFETYEVSVLLDYLKILDNGRQDLPLAAVLASPLGNLLTEDMAKIRVAYPDVPFHESARMYASEEAQDPVLKDRLMRFFSQVDHFRKKCRILRFMIC